MSLSSLAFIAMVLLIAWLWWEVRHATPAPEPRHIPPSAQHLACGECFWIHPAMWLFSSGKFPANLPDQLVISAYCPTHNTFAHKRWNEKHLDDKGMKNPWQTDVDNYRGFLED